MIGHIKALILVIRNKLKTAEDICELEKCEAVSSLGTETQPIPSHLSYLYLDLSYNNLDDPEVVEVLSRMLSLHVLNLIGNPLLRKTLDYRRNLLHKCQFITYLDSRPVTDKDRKCLAAWAKVSLPLLHTCGQLIKLN